MLCAVVAGVEVALPNTDVGDPNADCVVAVANTEVIDDPKADCVVVTAAPKTDEGDDGVGVLNTEGLDSVVSPDSVVAVPKTEVGLLRVVVAVPNTGLEVALDVPNKDSCAAPNTLEAVDGVDENMEPGCVEFAEALEAAVPNKNDADVVAANTDSFDFVSVVDVTESVDVEEPNIDV